MKPVRIVVMNYTEMEAKVFCRTSVRGVENAIDGG